MDKKLIRKPETHNGNLARLPSALIPLTEETRWVNWSWDLRESGGVEKWTKLPYRPRDLKLAKSNDSSSWGSYDRAVARYKNGDADGIGFMLLDALICAADLDHCCKRDANKKKTRIDRWASDLRMEVDGAYCEVTVSGTGLRLIGTAAGSDVQRKFSIEKAHRQAKLELFRNTTRYITISGLQLGDCRKLPSLDDFIDATLARYGRREERAEPGRQRADRDYDDLIRNGAQQGERSDLFHSVVWHLANKGWSVDQIVEELARYPNGIGLKYADRLKQEVARSCSKWQRINSGRREGLPVIRCIDGQIARMVDKAQHALIDAEVPIFVRGGMLVEPITVERPAAHDRTTLVTVFASLQGPKLGYLLNKHAAVFQRYDLKRKEHVEVDPPSKICSALATLKTWKFPEVVGVVGVPTMRPDGSLLTERGYDPKTRLWCNSAIILPAISEKPTFEEAKRALQLMKELLSEFPFVSVIDLSVALAAILSAVLRGAFDIVPLFAILAHDSGTGKSFLVDLTAVIVTGRLCPVITGSRSAEELEKRLAALLLEGSSMASLDNLSQDIEGDLLAQMVTQQYIKPRILGKSEVPECEWRGTLFATGNNIRVVGDMIRRTLVCWLAAKVERPELRSFKFNPIKRVIKNRSAYIAAAITIARAYQAATSKMPTMSPLVGFDSWSKTVREPLIWLGEKDPVSSMEVARAADPERAAAHELMRHWSRCIGSGKPVSASGMIGRANETREGSLRFPKFRAFLIEHVGTIKGDQIDPVRLGKWLRKQHGKVYDNVSIEIDTHKGRGNSYFLKEIDHQEFGL